MTLADMLHVVVYLLGHEHGGHGGLMEAGHWIVQ